VSENQAPIQKVRQVLAAGPVLEAEATPQQMRDGMNSLLGATPVPAEAQITAAELGGVPGEWVEMPGADAQRAVLYLHGGGYVLGSPQTHHALTTKLAQSAGARLFSLDYRLAPEHPFPAAVEDAAAAYRALLDAGFDASQVAVSGDSAGGGLTGRHDPCLARLPLHAPRRRPRPRNHRRIFQGALEPERRARRICGIRTRRSAARYQQLVASCL